MFVPWLKSQCDLCAMLYGLYFLCVVFVFACVECVCVFWLSFNVCCCMVCVCFVCVVLLCVWCVLLFTDCLCVFVCDLLCDVERCVFVCLCVRANISVV